MGAGSPRVRIERSEGSGGVVGVSGEEVGDERGVGDRSRLKTVVRNSQ